MDRNLRLTCANMRQMVETALANSQPAHDWPEPLKRAQRAASEPRVRQDLRFQFKLGIVITLGGFFVDLLAVPHLAVTALLIRCATVVPLSLLGLVLLRRGKVQSTKLIATLTLSLFGASVIALSAYGGADVIARYGMATIILLSLSIFALPFTMREKLRYTLVFSLVTVLAGLVPRPLPPELLLQHMVLLLLVGFGTLMLANRVLFLESRDFLRTQYEQLIREQLERSNDLLRELSESDPLTGLANRRNFERVFEELRRAAQGRPIALMMIDIDNFKDFNDRHGHQSGDRCLVAVARELGRCLAAHDGHVARFGGEEFVAVLLESAEWSGAAVAEHLRTTLAELTIATGGGRTSKITASFGVINATDAPSANEMIARADEALYRAKQMGRDRVELAHAGGAQDD